MADILTDQQWESIQDANQGVRLRRVRTAAGEIVLRAPSAAEEQAFQSMYFGSSMHAGMAWRNLLVMCTVHPDKLAMQAALAQWPGLAMNPRIIRELKLIRGEADEEEGK
jgi:hypothetical protein